MTGAEKVSGRHPGARWRDETYKAAAHRELHGELGVDEKDVKLGAQLAERSQNHAVGGREVCQIERYFPVRLTAADVGPARATQTENIRTAAGGRWTSRGPPDVVGLSRQVLGPGHAAKYS
ncbi:NUDIX domain-containing protein (plasmid) [Streptomyces sp. NBC_01450]|uniref:NUDIX hydrolase n=1 Tax=Streptomyces sp. NBC_01450 TaxID=2903871 RepID=UPI002E369E23|nr:NUDIX hydrolase [Streptomyces sp. NBC_01450]